MSSRRTIALAVLVALLQIGVLGWSIVDRASALRDGREIRLQVEPVDPRDLLRGDYVQLAYPASRVPRSAFQPPLGADLTVDGSTVWMRLEKAGDGYWKPIAASKDSPQASSPGPDQVDVKATGLTGWSNGDNGQQVAVVDYGINRYYVPEGEGRAIEQGIGVTPFSILAAVSEDGAIQIKALMDGDKKLYEEPWY